MFGDDVDDFLTAEVAGLPQECLGAVVVVGRVECELGGVASVGVPGDGVGDGPPCEGPGSLLHVLFAVVGVAVHPDAHGE